ncbi:MAG: ThuA domain-containing protein [Verrucomicrobiia bacterium]|tara:strand:- start:2897 stop:3862 length:966 start_codon:yes stop_codon:yes gene_type:complete
MFKKLFVCLLLVAFANGGFAAEKIKVMLLTGQSNKYHNWQGSSAAIRQHLEVAGIFQVDTVVAPALGGDFSSFAPNWSDYQAVVLDYDGEEWPESAKASFVKYVKNGGGLVTVHGTNNSFAYWPEFLAMTGVGGWGGRNLYDPILSPDDPSRATNRNETWGPRVYWECGEMVHDDSPGGATHPPRHDFLVTVRDYDHPVTRDLPEVWLHANDEVYANLRGPAKNISILATGFADPTLKNASPHNEPIIFTIGYGKGRILQNTMGHVGAKEDATVPSVQSVGFIVTLQRGVEWAATGEVTQSVPGDFPTAYHTSLRSASPVE